MSRGSPPLRFLMLVAAGWIGARAALLAPAWWAGPPGRQTATSVSASAAEPAPLAALPRAPPGRASERRIPSAPRVFQAPERVGPRPPAPAPVPALAAQDGFPPNASVPAQPAPQLLPAAPPPSAAAHSATSRWAFFGWAFVRRGGADSLAAGGMLGGSQVGARLRFRLNDDAARPLALSGRFYVPAGRARAAEAALGIEWKPVARLPVSLLAERRQALGKEGRSAFSLTMIGGLDRVPVAGALRLDAYGQAGVVGARARDLFADGSARLSLPFGMAGRIEAGAGLWGAAQPGVTRIDVGPQASIRLPVANFRVAADWRFRVAGKAAPGSGPAITLSTGF